MPPDDPEITLGVLNVIHSNDGWVTQRHIATDLGIALGLANTYLRRCVSKGLIKVKQIPARRYSYYLTPSGFREKSRLAAEFFSQSVQLFRVARCQAEEILLTCRNRGLTRIALWGCGDLAEIILLCAGGFPDIQVVGLVGEEERTLHGLPVATSLDGLPHCDAVIISALSGPADAVKEASKSFSPRHILVPPFLSVPMDLPEFEMENA